MTAITELLQVHPEVALFAALSLGFFLGKRKVGSFSLGTSPGVLLAGVLIGQLRIPIPPLLKAVSFALFIFVVGYRVGPQFFRGLRGEGLRLAALALILAVTGLLTAYATAVLLGYDKGTAAGLLGGSLTQSASTSARARYGRLAVTSYASSSASVISAWSARSPSTVPPI